MIMRIVLILAIPIMSVVFSLMSSGIENQVTASNPGWRTIPILYWMAFWSIVWYSVYRIRFGNLRLLKIFLLRAIIRLRVRYLALQIINNQPEELDRMQRKALAIWSQVLRDKGTRLATCVISNRRMVIREGITCVLADRGDANFMFMKAGDKDVYFDVHLPQHAVSSMYNSFDREQKARFDIIIEHSRELISSSVTLSVGQKS